MESGEIIVGRYHASERYGLPYAESTVASCASDGEYRIRMVCRDRGCRRGGGKYRSYAADAFDKVMTAGIRRKRSEFCLR